MRTVGLAICFVVLFAVLGGAVMASGVEGSPSLVSCDEEGCLLDIADRGWDPLRPNKSVGWCGEASIQMAALYYGAYFPQGIINQAGEPAHPDLYGEDIPQALDALGLFTSTYVNRVGESNLPAFLEWIKEELRNGHPVFVGVKIYPDEHSTWAYDHFVLVVGYTADGLIYNTNIEGQRERSVELLSSRQGGYAFANRFNDYFGYAITGFQHTREEPRVFLLVQAETFHEVELEVTQIDLEPGAKYTLRRFCVLSEGPTGPVSVDAACWAETFVAEAASHTIVHKVDRDEIAIYRCLIFGSHEENV